MKNKRTRPAAGLRVVSFNGGACLLRGVKAVADLDAEETAALRKYFLTEEPGAPLAPHLTGRVAS